MSGPTKCKSCKIPLERVDGEYRCPNCYKVYSSGHQGAWLVDVDPMPDEEIKAIIDDRLDILKLALSLDEPPDKEPSFLCSYCPYFKICKPEEYSE